ncbi:hypothetical protein ACFWIB_16980 [Streptomyces sp. NPDC127051]|uniref:hypothetical protein n=1 Tax=Streptomyces sp. NPDC127051 TaxID=3347119 RepID=UPI0036573BE5
MKRSEYETIAPKFRASLLAEAAKPEADRVWPDVDGWLTVQALSTCTTPTCVNFGWGFPVTLHENADGVHRCICGECGESTTLELLLEDD